MGVAAIQGELNPGADLAFLESQLGTLDRTERLVLILYFAEELTSAEIALILDLSEPRVREIRLSMVERLKHAFWKREGCT